MGLSACPHEEPPDIELGGERTLVRREEGVLPLFDPKAPPELKGLRRGDRVELALDGEPARRIDQWLDDGPDGAAAPESPVRARIQVRDADGTIVHTAAILWWRGPREGDDDAWSQPFVLFETGRAHRKDSAFREAERLWTQAAEAALQVGTPGFALRAYVAAAYSAIRAHRFQRASTLLQLGEDLAQDDRGDLDLALLAFRSGVLARKLMDLREARTALQRAMGLVGRSALMSETYVLAEMRVLASDAGAHESALADVDSEAIESEFERALAQGSQLWVTIRAMNAGAIAWDLARLRDLAETQVATFERLGHPAEAGEALMNLAYAESLQGEYEAAQRTWRRAIALDPRLETQTFGALLRGRLAEQGSAWSEAQAAYQEVVERGLEDQSPDDVWRAHHGLARVAEASGDPASARTEYEAALAARRSAALGAPLRFGRSTFTADRAQVVRDAARFFLAAGDVAAAFQALDEEQGRTLRDLESRLRVGRLQGAARTRYLERLGRYRRLRARYAEARQEKTEGMKALAASLTELNTLRARMQAAFDAAYEALEAGGEVQGDANALAEVQAALAPEDALLLSANFEDQAFRLVITATRSLHAQVEPGAALPKTLQSALRNRRHLYLVGPPPPGLVLAPELTRSSLPFAAILTRPPVQTEAEPLVVSNPTGDLPSAGREGALVQEALQARRLDDQNATLAAVSAAISEARHLHFSGHGVGTAADAWSSHLLLTDEAELSLEDIVALRPRVKSVVLSGCETGRSTRLSARDSMSLADAFLISGAQWVLASNDLLPDSATQRFVERFYEEGGLVKPAQTLRRLQRSATGRARKVAQAFRLHGRPF